MGWGSAGFTPHPNKRAPLREERAGPDEESGDKEQMTCIQHRRRGKERDGEEKTEGSKGRQREGGCCEERERERVRRTGDRGKSKDERDGEDKEGGGDEEERVSLQEGRRGGRDMERKLRSRRIKGKKGGTVKKDRKWKERRRK